MGKRGPKSRLGGRKAPWTFRPDEETIVALTRALCARRAVQPRATMADVIRSVCRAADPEVQAAYDAQQLAELKAAKDALATATARVEALEAMVTGRNDKAEQERRHHVDVAVRSLATNPKLVDHVQELVKLEAAGLVATSSYPSLQRARRGVASWQDLLQRRDAP